MQQKYLSLYSKLGNRTTRELGMEGAETIKDVCKRLNPVSVLEIGFNRGSSALAFLLYSQCNLTSIDINREDISIKLLKENFANRFTFHQKNSITICDNKEWVKSFDLIFIDGDHSYEAMKVDIMNAIELRSKYILLDDWFHCSHGNDLHKIIEDIRDKLQLIKEYNNVCGQALFKVVT